MALKNKKEIDKRTYFMDLIKVIKVQTKRLYGWTTATSQTSEKEQRQLSKEAQTRYKFSETFYLNINEYNYSMLNY